MDYYPGTMRPANFRSRVTVIDKGGKGTKAVIHMNHPLRRGATLLVGLPTSRKGVRCPSCGCRGIRACRSCSAAPAHGARRVRRAVHAPSCSSKPSACAPRAKDRPRVCRSSCAARSSLRRRSRARRGRSGAGSPARSAAGGAARARRDAPAACRCSDGREMPFDTEARESVRLITGQRVFGGIDPVRDGHGLADGPARLARGAHHQGGRASCRSWGSLPARST